MPWPGSLSQATVAAVGGRRSRGRSPGPGRCRGRWLGRERGRTSRRRAAGIPAGCRGRCRPPSSDMASPAGSADSVIRAARVGVGQGVVEQVVQGVAKAVRVGGDRRQVARLRRRSARRACPRRGRGVIGGRRCSSAAGVFGPQVERLARLLQPGQRQQLFDLIAAAVRRCRGRRAAVRSAWASSGPTVSSSSRCRARRTLVSGVFSSWLTVATRSLLIWSSRRKRVTSLRTTAAPSVLP